MADIDQPQGITADLGVLAAAIDPSFRSVAESLSDHITLLDPAGFIHYANNTVPDLTVAQILGTSVYRYVPEEYRDVMSSAPRPGARRSVRRTLHGSSSRSAGAEPFSR